MQQRNSTTALIYTSFIRRRKLRSFSERYVIFAEDTLSHLAYAFKQVTGDMESNRKRNPRTRISSDERRSLEEGIGGQTPRGLELQRLKPDKDYLLDRVVPSLELACHCCCWGRFSGQGA